MRKPKRILVCRPDRIGDVILSTPLIRELKISFPDLYLAVLVNPYTRDVLVHNPYIDDFILDDPSDSIKYSFWKQVRNIRKFKFDTALMLLSTERLNWMLFFAGIPRRIGVGTKLYQILSFSRSVSRHKYIPLRHEADYCMDLGRKIGADCNSLDTEIFIKDTEKEDLAQRIIIPHLDKFDKKKYKLICIHPGNSRSAPNWSIEKYNELCEKLLEDENNIIFITGNSNEMHFVPSLKNLGMKRMINLIGKLNIRELCSLISLMDILVSSSTGPMHIAAALKVVTVSLFCPLTACSPTLWGPLGNTSEILLPPENYCKDFCKNDPHSCTLDEGIPTVKAVDQINNILSEIK